MDKIGDAPGISSIKSGSGDFACGKVLLSRAQPAKIYFFTLRRAYGPFDTPSIIFFLPINDG